MASKSVICCVITILLVNTNLALSLDLSESLQRFRRAIVSENPAEEINNIVNQDFSRANVHSYVRSLVPESLEILRRSSVNEDLLGNLVRNYVGDARIKRAASNDDVQSILDVLNSEIGGEVLVTSNVSVVIDVDALAGVLRKQATTYIQDSYPGNIYAQIVASTVVDQQIKTLSENLRTLLADKGISVELISQITSLISNSSRAKRDLVSDLILQLLRPQIAAILTPIQTEFNTVVDKVVTVILTFYVAEAQQSDSIFAVISNFINMVVLRVSELVVVFRQDVNTIFDNLINGTVTTTARRRRDTDLEFENYYNLERVALEIPHRRVTRDIVSDIFTLVTNPISFIFSVVVSPITNILNAVVKNIFITLLSSQYATIGNIVTFPLRFIVNYILDLILPCTDCVSIV